MTHTSLLITAATLLATTAHALVLVDTVADFSTAEQGINGLYYGYYAAAESQDASLFSTVNIAAGSSGSDPAWIGPESYATPLFTANVQHPSVDFAFPAVRRYLVGDGAELDYSGQVQIVGSFGGATPGGGGAVVGFVNVNNVTLFSGQANGSVVASFNFLATVSPGDTIDFGLRLFDGAAFDSTFTTALVTAVPEPSAFGPTLVLLGVLVARRLVTTARSQRVAT